MNRLSLRNQRLAFTLVETLLALALSSALLVAVFSLVDRTVTYHVTGNDQVLFSQRMIGLLQDLRSDIRAVESDPHWLVTPEVQASFDERLQRVTTPLTSSLQLSGMEKFAEPIRLVGQDNWLVLTLGHANPRWSRDAAHHQQVIWSLGGAGSLSVPTHENNGRWTNQTISDPGRPGLFRSRLVSQADNGSKVQSDYVTGAQQLRFRFLASGKWRANWNSSTEKRLPDAIEIDLQLIGDAQRRTWVVQLSSLPIGEE